MALWKSVAYWYSIKVYFQFTSNKNSNSWAGSSVESTGWSVESLCSQKERSKVVIQREGGFRGERHHHHHARGRSETIITQNKNQKNKPFFVPFILTKQSKQLHLNLCSSLQQNNLYFLYLFFNSIVCTLLPVPCAIIKPNIITTTIHHESSSNNFIILLG